MKTCMDCGTDISHRVPWALYCHPCLHRRARKSTKEEYRRRRDAHIEHTVAITCIDCGTLVLKQVGLYCDRCREIRKKAYLMKHRLNTESRLHAHRHPNFETEEERIINEMRRLKLLIWRRSGMERCTLPFVQEEQ